MGHITRFGQYDSHDAVEQVPGTTSLYERPVGATTLGSHDSIFHPSTSFDFCCVGAGIHDGWSKAVSLDGSGDYCVHSVGCHTYANGDQRRIDLVTRISNIIPCAIIECIDGDAAICLKVLNHISDNRHVSRDALSLSR